jgi:hypothetical protein
MNDKWLTGEILAEKCFKQKTLVKIMRLLLTAQLFYLNTIFKRLDDAELL